MTQTTGIVVVVTMKNVSPWREIFLHGQMPTWIKQCVNAGISVLTLEAEKSIPLQEKLDRFVERWRYGNIVGPLVRGLLSLLNSLLPEPETKWRLEEPARGFPTKIVENSPSLYLTMYRRNKALFEWFVNNSSFDWLYRVHSSSFVMPAGLMDFVSSIDPSMPIAAGKEGTNSQGYPFLSGAGILFSRAAVLQLHRHSSTLRRDLPEDVSLGVLLDELKIPRIAIERVDYSDPSQILHSSGQPSIFHFRCKSPNRPDGDIRIMLKLSKAFE